MRVRQGSLGEARQVFNRVPEFDSSQDDEFAQRLGQAESCVLVAEVASELVGFKMGYDRYGDGSFYSWLGGVVPEHRKSGVALLLLREQESWAKANGYQRIYVKTRNAFVGMRVLLAKSGYELLQVNATTLLADARLLHVKELSG